MSKTRRSSDTTLPSRRDRITSTLMVFTGDGVVQHALPNVPSLVVGRAPRCNIVVNDPSLSREHLRLILEPRPAIEDLDSVNGTRVAGKLLKPNTIVPLTPGVLIEAGDVGLIWRIAVGPDVTPLEAPAMHDVLSLVQRLAKSALTILILGETGSGKEIMAETIHEQSPRSSRKLLRLNCAAFNETLIESELFGHERGAFTGANVAKPGLLETADGGTVLLDEIGDLSLSSQVKLLRVLDERKVWRAGALAPRSINVRFLAATHRNLESLVETGAFRQDLFFRLNAITLRVPPLRERVDEIEPLAERFLREASLAMSRVAPVLSPSSRALLLSHGWPGNVRELKNVIGRAVALCEEAIQPEHLELRRAGSSAPASLSGTRPARTGLREDVLAVEREHISAALASCNGNRSQAAKLLGIARNTLASRMARLDLDDDKPGRRS